MQQVVTFACIKEAVLADAHVFQGFAALVPAVTVVASTKDRLSPTCNLWGTSTILQGDKKLCTKLALAQEQQDSKGAGGRGAALPVNKFNNSYNDGRCNVHNHLLAGCPSPVPLRVAL